jgi:hypothetical protein
LIRYALTPGHYAFDWAHQENLTSDDITVLGIRYHAMTNGPEREAVMLRILKSFHNYVVKYTDMIRRGHLPTYRSHVNHDSMVLLRYFLPAGKEPNRMNLQTVCRTLHLGFLNQPYDEVYNILAGIVIRAVCSFKYANVIRRADICLHSPATF